MAKRCIALVLAAIMLVSLAACRGTDPQTDPNGDQTENYKIGILTGTVSQGEEEYQAAQNMAKKYDDKIVTATYPDSFQTETETTIANAVSLASDPEVQAIVFVQAVPGAAAAIDKVRETRPDMLFICGVDAEDPATIASKSDIVLLVDEISMGKAIPQKAAEMGAKTFIHYSFARHLSYATIAARRILMIETCKELGMDFLDVTAPDPTGDAGVSGAQQFILEDVPSQVAQYGKDTCFFSTNCAMQEPLQVAILEQGAIYPQPCCPGPYHGFPAALGIDVAGHEGDVDYMLAAIKTKLEEKNMAGRMSTWTLPVNMTMIEIGTRYAVEFCEGRTNGRFDMDVLNSVLKEVAGDGAKLTPYADANGTLDNFLMFMGSYYDFSTGETYTLEY